MSCGVHRCRRGEWWSGARAPWRGGMVVGQRRSSECGTPSRWQWRRSWWVVSPRPPRWRVVVGPDVRRERRRVATVHVERRSSLLHGVRRGRVLGHSDVLRCFVGRGVTSSSGPRRWCGAAVSAGVASVLAVGVAASGGTWASSASFGVIAPRSKRGRVARHCAIGCGRRRFASTRGLLLARLALDGAA